jgi:hypothetical protein
MSSKFVPRPDHEYRLVRILNDANPDPRKWYNEWYLIESADNQGVNIGGPWIGDIEALERAAKILGNWLYDWQEPILNGDGEPVVIDADVKDPSFWAGDNLVTPLEPEDAGVRP